MAISTQSFQQEVGTMLMDKLQREANTAFDEYKKEAVEKFAQQIEDKRDELIAKMALRVYKTFDIHSAGDQVIITIKKENM